MTPATAPLVMRRRLVSRAAAPPVDALQDPLRAALEQVFAHYCDVLAERLDRVPETHLRAFVDMLGASPEPAVPAHAPLVFKAARAPASAPVPVVPKFTEVAAPPAAGDTEPVVFQTVEDLEVLRAEFAKSFAVDGARGVIAQAQGVVSAEGLAPGATILSHAVPLVRAMHVGHRSLLGAPDLASVLVQVEMGHVGAMPPNATVEWGIGSPAGFVALTPLRDTTAGLAQSGEIAFDAPPPFAAVSMCGTESCWLTCRLRSSDAMHAAPGSAPAPATITRLRLSARRALEDALPDAALSGRMPLDLTRDFYPFGERPRFGDVFYLASKSFGIGNAQVVLHIRLTNPADAAPDASPIAPVTRDGEPRVVWESHTRSGWQALAAEDRTHALTNDATVSFTLPGDAAQGVIGNVESGWLRARLVSGSYATGRRVIESLAIPADAPPSIASIRATMSLNVGPVEPERIVVDDNLEETCFDPAATHGRLALTPFPASEVAGLALYLGVKAAPTQLAGRMLSLYMGLAPCEGRAVYRDDAAAARTMRWQVRGTDGWRECAVVDRTGGLRRPGFVSVHVGNDVARWHGAVFDQQAELVWLRLVTGEPAATCAASASASAAMAIRQIVLNAVPAVQAIRLERELLGSGNGRPAQTLRTARRPVVGDVRLDVREGDGGLARDWVRWQCVDDLSASDHDARAFVLDRLTGTVRFGDGRHGRIPPAGGNNIRISYSAGGGARGNRPPHAIAQLRTTIPYVESVTNCDPATGGQDTESEVSLRRAALARLRHRDRAVCADDYADLALRASPEVMRAMCRGGRDLSRADSRAHSARGAVSVVIVPDVAAAEPQPALALLARVKTYLEARAPAGVELILLGPAYLRVAVDAELAVAPNASSERVIAACEARVNAFLHPLTGGAGGDGWAFGKEPHASDLLAALDEIDGIDHVRALRLRFEADARDLRRSGDFLVSAGRHTIRASR